MKRIFKNQLIKDCLVISVAFALLIFISAENKEEQDSHYTLPKAVAAVNDNLSGYAWSDNIGWISFNCTDTDTCTTSHYGVSIESNQEMSGYAWSDNIGWISFNESDLDGCPSGLCQARLDGNKLVGWARALSGVSSDDGWDGWISLGTQSSDSISYGVELNEDSVFNGFAWGDEIVGWIDFNSDFGEVLFLGAFPSIESFQVSSVVTGNKPIAYFTTENADSCDLVSDTGYEDLNICHNENQCATVETLVDKEITEETTYTLTCFNDLGMNVENIFTPFEYFELTGNPLEVLIDFAGGAATTTPTEIGVIPWNGFTSQVSLSADLSGIPESPGDETTNTATFSPVVLSFSEYFTNNAKSILEIFASYRFTGKEYIEVLGNGSESLSITINAGNIEPVYEEI